MRSYSDNWQVNVDFILGTPSVLPKKDKKSEGHGLCSATKTKWKPVIFHPASYAQSFVRLAQRDNLTL